MPVWDLNTELTDILLDIIDDFNLEYVNRRTVLSRRLDVTIQAFLKSPNAEKSQREIQDLVKDLKWKNETPTIGMWHLLAATTALLDMDRSRISSKHTVSSAVKTVIIGHVPDRGGVPEGYTMEDIGKDVTKANVLLTKKDGGGGGFASGAIQSTVKRWQGAGMGVGDSSSTGGKDGKGGKVLA